jgi:hypothetical protein
MALETYDHEGYTVSIDFDADYEANNPREWSVFSRLFCWHPNYILGDEQFVNAEGRGAVDKGGAQFETIEDVYNHIVEQGGVNIIPLFLYDHSGISLIAGPTIETLSPEDVSTAGRNLFDSAGWDTSWVGFAFTTPQSIAESRCPEDEIDALMRDEIRIYSSYLRGEVYFYCVEDADRNASASPRLQPWVERADAEAAL